MIEVRIRHAADDEAVHLCEVPFSEIDKVVSQVGAWSVIDNDSGNSYGPEDVTGRFVVDGTRAYFEVIVGEV